MQPETIILGLIALGILVFSLLLAGRVTVMTRLKPRLRREAFLGTWVGAGSGPRGQAPRTHRRLQNRGPGHF